MRRVILGSLFALFGAGVASGAAASTLYLDRVADPTGVTQPVYAISPPGDADRLFVVELKTGAVKIFDLTTGSFEASPFLTLPSVGQTAEQGAYAIAFAPDYATSGKFYVSLTTPDDKFQVLEYSVSADPNLADAASGRAILSIQHPDDGQQSHYGGWIGFGPDGHLYVTTGDSNADPIDGAAQDRSNLLGSVLRIDPAAGSDPENNYSTPADNPFAGGDAADDAVYAYGLRNPYRAAFDPVTGAFLISDVGEDNYEEVNLGIAGANYGWPGREGAHDFMPALLDGAPVTDPIYEYLHGAGAFDGQSITGGEFYQGPVDALDGMYFFGDFVAGKIWSFVYDDVTKTVSDLIAWDIILDAGIIEAIVSFGRDGDGNLYVVDINGSIWRIADAVISEVPLPAAWLFMLVGVAGMLRSRRGKRALT